MAEFRGHEPVSALQLEYSLAERDIEHEFVPLGTGYGMGVMVWSPLAGGLLSGKYRPSEDGGTGTGRLETTKGSANPAFRKFSERNWRIVAELEAVAKETGRSMAQVALNWVVHRPGVASVILGATKIDQLRDNLAALAFDLPEELCARLDAAGQQEPPYPSKFFGPELQGMIHGGVAVGAKPRGYAPVVESLPAPEGEPA